MDSTSSHKDAAESIIQHIAFTKGILETKSKSVAFVKETFVKVLMGAKKSECDNLVEECIANRKRISGTVYYYPEKEPVRITKNTQRNIFMLR